MTVANSAISDNKPVETESVTLGGGCFWCVEALYETLDGVESVESGYAGGSTANPSYKDISTGTTGHAEVVKVTFDPKTISLERLLSFFWQAHDPTTLNRQGADVGTQYRSIILYSSPEQKAAAESSMAEAQKIFTKPIVTEIVALESFYKAEGYHQDYYKNNKTAPYCQYVIAPKLKKLEQ
ncbi:peptide-methionine (S)-S-oxide reductase MsrA [Puniceicoccales bacterium CK1056]|uniref:Peptide methionine sulfoxide reductase MsrA n=1 Tax=Oceanipulchritudo coccoides TaxID=2706888 RepID=A0A6B2M5M2_9BACT|nr:peptide-methionine (S)-S-oxide reductase MsrA [Oceanipulchritudo coccoides]